MKSKTKALKQCSECSECSKTIDNKLTKRIDG